MKKEDKITLYSKARANISAFSISLRTVLVCTRDDTVVLLCGVTRISLRSAVTPQKYKHRNQTYWVFRDSCLSCILKMR